MGLIDLTLGRVRVPLFDLATIGAGFYIGYYEGKGIDMSLTKEFLAKYGPTVFSIVLTPLKINLKYAAKKYMAEKFDERLSTGILVIREVGEDKKILKDIEETERRGLEEKISEQLERKHKALEDLPEYTNPTVHMGLRTVVETTIGYVVGSLCSRLI